MSLSICSPTDAIVGVLVCIAVRILKFGVFLGCVLVKGTYVPFNLFTYRCHSWCSNVNCCTYFKVWCMRPLDVPEWCVFTYRKSSPGAF